MDMTSIATVYLLYLLNGVILGIGFWWSFDRRRLYSMLWAALLAFHLLSFLDLSGLEASFHLTTLLDGQLFMLLGNITLLGSIAFFDKGPFTILPRFIQTLPKRYFGRPTSETGRYVVVIVGVALFSLSVQYFSNPGMLSSNWIEARSVDDRFYLRPLSTILGFLFFPSIWVAIRARKLLPTLILILCGLVLFFVSGSRAMFSTFGGAIFIDVLTSNQRLRSKLLIVVVGAFAGYFVHVSLRVLRGLGLGGLLAAVSAGTLGDWVDGHQDILGLGGEEGTYQTYYYVVESDYDFYPYRSWVTPLRLSMIYVPSAFTGGMKPQDITSQLWFDGFDDGFLNDSHDYDALKDVAYQGIGGSIHPHLWGDAFVNGHVMGIVLYGIVLGFVVVVFDRAFLHFGQLTYFTLAPCFCVSLMFIARGSVVAGVGCVAFGLPFVILLSLMSQLPLFVQSAANSEHESFELPMSEAVS